MLDRLYKNAINPFKHENSTEDIWVEIEWDNLPSKVVKKCLMCIVCYILPDYT